MDIDKLLDKSGISWALGNQVKSPQLISTTLPELDYVMGGGVPLGRVSYYFGPEGCLDKDMFVHYEIRSKTGSSHRGGSIERLYHRFHRIRLPGLGNWIRPQTENAEFFVPSINEAGRIFRNRVLDVVDSGVKECYEMVLSTGETLIATADHKIFVGDRYASLGELEKGSTVYIHNNTPYTSGHEHFIPKRPDVKANYHPFARERIHYDIYRYRYMARSRAVLEAQINNLSLDEYVRRLNDDQLKGLIFLPQDVEIHHIDENFTNDEPSNLLALTHSEHARYHALKDQNNLRFTIVPSTVVSITPVGERHTYDLKCEAPYNNYVANGIVVHNSGKTTFMLKAAHQIMLETGKPIVWVDIENSWYPDWVIKHFPSLDKVYTIKGSGESVADVLKDLIKEKFPSAVVLDSLSAVTSSRVLEDDWDKTLMGVDAKFNNRMIKVLNCVNDEVAIMIIGQYRESMGAFNHIPGGYGIRSFSNIILEFSKTFLRAEEPDLCLESKEPKEIVGTKCRFKSVKSRQSPIGRYGEEWILSDGTIDTFPSRVRCLLRDGKLVRGGAWYQLGNEKIQGIRGLKRWAAEHPDLWATILEP